MNARLIRHPGLDPLWESIEREHRTQQFAALLLVLIGLAACLLGIRFDYVLAGFLGAVGATAGLYWLFRLLSNQPVAAWREDLRDHPDYFVWVYSTVTERAPFGLNLMRAGTLYLIEDDGTSHSFSIPPRHLLLVSKTLNRLLPHAEFGYTSERERRYRGEQLTRPK